MPSGSRRDKRTFLHDDDPRMPSVEQVGASFSRHRFTHSLYRVLGNAYTRGDWLEIDGVVDDVSRETSVHPEPARDIVIGGMIGSTQHGPGVLYQGRRERLIDGPLPDYSPDSVYAFSPYPYDDVSGFHGMIMLTNAGYAASVESGKRALNPAHGPVMRVLSFLGIGKPRPEPGFAT